jgi:hypothetical protein
MAAVLVGWFLAMPPAAAQQQSVDESGIKLGRLRLRPRLGLNYTLDSNVFLRDADEGQGPLIAHRMDIAPAISLTTAPDAPMSFSLGAGAEYRLYLSDDPNIKNLSDASVTVDLDATFNPRGDVTFSVLENFRRTTAAPTLELPLPYNRDVNRAGARLGIQPGGKALTFDVYYYFTYDHYENFGFGSTGAQSLDNASHEVIFRSRWKFLPKTAFISEIQGTFLSWDTPQFNNPNLLRAYVGVVGNLTAKLTVTARVGYGNSFHSAGPVFNSVLGDLEVGYQFAELGTARFGYAREFFPGPWGNYFDTQRVGAGVDTTVFRRLGLSSSVSYIRLGFGGNPDATLLGGAGATLLSNEARVDHVFAFSLAARVAIMRLLSFQLAYSLETRSSNNGIRFSTPRGTVVESFDYTRHVVSAGLAVAY